MINKLDTKKYKEMLLYGGEILKAKKEEINALNVFPVPDGDTGFNMNMTIEAGTKNILNYNSDNVGDLAQTYSKGLLMGARGNSGVILSQFFRGLSEGLVDKKEITTKEFHRALELGVKRAYASVINAVEGTILTVVREMTENTKNIDEDFVIYFEELMKNANDSLNNTPNLLPVLKEVGVVDSGGAGIVAVFDGMFANLKGEELEIESSFDLFTELESHPMNPDEIEFGYCTEMLIRLNDPSSVDINNVRATLEKMGDSIVAIIDDNILKIHVHTEEPIKAFEYGLSLGEFVHVKSENMRIQAEEAQELRKKEMKEVGIVSVASSKEMGELFKQYNPDVYVISGGQTLNPSTEDIVKAINEVNAKKVIILPNNSNIIMAAESAKDLVENVEVEIIKTKHMTSAIECLVQFDVELSFEDNINKMKEILEDIINIEITNAIKDTSIEGVEIKKDDYLLIVNGKIRVSNSDIKYVLNIIFDNIKDKDFEVVYLLSGEDGDIDYINDIVGKLEDDTPFVDYFIFDTKQPIYQYLISLV